MIAILFHDINSLDLSQKVIVRVKGWTSYSTLGKMLIHIEHGEAVLIRPGVVKKFRTTRQVKREVRKRDNRMCVYCGNPATTIDHIVPRCYGGITSLRNCVSSCEPCNTAKGVKSLSEFMPNFVIKTI